jgi:phosphoglycerate dehydrogenase-like enzyme
LLALARNIPQAVAAMRQSKREQQKANFVGEDLYGKTLAIVGLGKVGMEVATRMQAFGMRIIGFDPVVKQEVGFYILIALVFSPKIAYQFDVIRLGCRKEADQIVFI